METKGNGNYGQRKRDYVNLFDSSAKRQRGQHGHVVDYTVIYPYYPRLKITSHSCDVRKDYFGKPKVSLNSFIWASLMPSGSNPMFLAAM